MSTLMKGVPYMDINTKTPADICTLALLIKAKRIAYKAHEGQTDMSGMPYIEHPLVVSYRCSSIDSKIVGMLHDVIEDTDISYDDLRAEGFPEHIIEAIRCVTKEEGWDEGSYFTRIKANPIAREVKINDLTHNLDEYRVVTPTAHLIEKRVKYRRELAFLQGCSDTL